MGLFGSANRKSPTRLQQSKMSKMAKVCGKKEIAKRKELEVLLLRFDSHHSCTYKKNGCELPFQWMIDVSRLPGSKRVNCMTSSSHAESTAGDQDHAGKRREATAGLPSYSGNRTLESIILLLEEEEEEQTNKTIGSDYKSLYVLVI